MQPSKSLVESTVTADEQKMLYAEQVKQLYSNSLLGLLATGINSLVLAGILRAVIPPANLVIWIGLLAGISIWRYRDIHTFRRRSLQPSEADHRGKKFIFFLSLSGLAWGSSAILLFPTDSLAHQIFLAFVVGGMVAGAAAAFSSILKAFLAYSVPALGPIIVRLAITGDELHLAMGGMTLLFGVMMFFTAMHIHNIRITSVKLQFENSGLGSYLVGEKKKSDKLHERLRLEVQERKRMEKELLDEKYSILFNTTSDGVWIQNINGEILEANDAYCRMSGYSRDELTNMPISKLEAVETSEEIVNHIKKVIDTDGHDRFESRHRRKDGSIFDVDINALYFKKEDGRIGVFVRDITERKRMEEELRRSRDKLELRVQERTEELKKQAELIELSHDAILVRDMENRIIFWSKGAEEVYGWRKEEVLGQTAYKLFQTKYPVPMNEIMAALTEKGRWDGELTHFRKDGQKLIVLSRQAIRRDEAGKPIDILQINIDITQIKRIEEQLQQAHKMEALGTLAGGIAHDFNNLLTPISINTEMALMDVKDGMVPSAESLEMALSSVRRGKDLVKQIITFSRHKGEELKPVDIAPITKETIKFLRSVIPATVQFETRIEDPSGLVLANPTQIHQILMNLVNNAASSMEPDGGILEINLEKLNLDDARAAMLPGPYLCLQVKDTGHGMTPEVIEKAFDPFFTTKAPGKGAGLGLAVVHGIVKRHRGDILLESEPGKGTTLRIFLPVFQGMKEEELPFPALKVRGGSERILFIDDEELQTRTAEAMLKRLGYHAVTETDPRKALGIFRAQPDSFDLVITDQVMPHLPGNRLSQELLAIRPDIPIILCTGFSEAVDEEKAEALGIKDFILKPFSTKEISQVIRKVLGQTGNA